MKYNGGGDKDLDDESEDDDNGSKSCTMQNIIRKLCQTIQLQIYLTFYGYF